MRTAPEGDGGGGVVVYIQWWWQCGCAFANTRQERGLGAKNHETEHNGSISDAPCETTVEDDGGRWWGGTNEVVVVVGPRIHKHEAQEGAGVKNHKTERDGSISGAPCETTVDGDGGRWWGGINEVVMVVGPHIRKCEAGEGAGGQNHETERDGSISGVPCETAVEGDGGRGWCGVDDVVVVVGLRMRKRKAGEGLGAKSIKLSHYGSVSGCF
jgi:hypothetical protein